MSFDCLKGKKVFGVETHTHRSHYTTTQIEITFEDGLCLVIFPKGQGDLRAEVRLGKPLVKKILPWQSHDQEFSSSLSAVEKAEYQKVREAFFWLTQHPEEVHRRYSYFDKTLRNPSRRSRCNSTWRPTIPKTS